MRVSVLLASPLIAIAACRPGNYTHARGPRFVGGPAIDDQRGRNPDTLVVTSFNIAFSRQIDSAVAVVRSDPMLRRADIVLLQEMDDDGTRRVAEAERATRHCL